MLTRPRFMWLAVLGMAGSAIGHSLGYLLAHPHGQERAAVLSQSGHSYWNASVTIVAFGALTALMAEFVLNYRADARRPQTRFIVDWITLCAVQGGLFILVEALERWFSASSHPQFWQEPAFWLALPIQVVVAALLVLVVRGASFVAHVLARKSATGALYRSTIQPRMSFPARVSFSRRLFASSFPSRAPPALSPV